MSRSRRQLRVRNPNVLLLLPLLARPHCHAHILRTKPVDHSFILGRHPEFHHRLVGDPRVVPCFRCAVFIDTSPSSTPGSSSVARTQFLRRQRWPSSPHKSLGTSQIPTIRFPWGNPFRGWTTIRICYDLSICSPPLADLTRLYAQPTGTFTSGLPTDWSPAPSPDMTTVATGQVP